MLIFGICSSINGKDKGVFNSEQRFDQTKNTIKSIREKVKDSLIVICENSELSEDHKNELVSLVDIFTTASEYGLEKSRNESRQMISVIKCIEKLDYEAFFKISGRYFLNEKFDISNYKLNKINFKKIDQPGNDHYNTVLYSFNKHHESLMKDAYQKFIDDNLKGEDIEHGLRRLIKENVNGVIDLGVSGIVAPTGGEVIL